jgi:hypothetical protein
MSRAAALSVAPSLQVVSDAGAEAAALIGLGQTAQKATFGVRLAQLLDGRLLIHGTSGAGKSWLLRRLLEQSSGRIQQIVIDPEGEFRSLAESADYPLIDASRLDGRGFAALGLRVRAQRLSVVLDVSQVDRESQMVAVAGFLRAIVECPREHWHPALVVIDEAHLFAPFGGQGIETTATRRAVTAAVVDLMSRGRKRGLATAIATLRLARLSKSVMSEATNFLVGRNMLDLDIRRAAQIIGWDARRAFEMMPHLAPGHFIASGTAFTHAAAIATIGAVRSRHLGAAPEMSTPPLPSAEEAEALLGIEDLNEEAEEAQDRLPAGARAVRGFMLHGSAALAARIVQELLPLFPNGAAIAELGTHLGATAAEVHAAIDLLAEWGAVVLGDGAVRIERAMRDRARC